jgi:hypothetical protein
MIFKTGGRRVTPSPMGSTPIRFRHFVLNELAVTADFVAT